MWHHLIEIKSSYLQHLADERNGLVLDCRYDSRTENDKVLRLDLMKLLQQTGLASKAWIFSFLGALSTHKLLGVLNLIEQRQFEVSYFMTEVHKETNDAPNPFVEISFGCNLSLLQWLLTEESLSIGWDFQLAGWRLPIASERKYLPQWKFSKGKICFPKNEVDMIFCSSDDWDCIQFASCNIADLKPFCEQVKS